MQTVARYRTSVVILLILLTISSGTGAYLYQLRTSDANNQASRSADLNTQVSSLNKQLDSLRLQIQSVNTDNTASDTLKLRVANLETAVLQLQTQLLQLQTTNQVQAGQIQKLQDQVKQLQAEVDQLKLEIQQLRSPLVLNGVGASFPQPFLLAVSANYTRNHPGVQMNYDALGSGAGIIALIQKTVDFAASDAPMTDAERQAGPNILHIPETTGSVVFAYNVPGIPRGLNITGPVVAGIFLGTITKWNDAAIQSLNPALSLPTQPIQVVHRSDGSGTTFVWTSYLSIVSQTWNSTVGSGKSIPWPIGIGAAGNLGVAGVVQGTPYTAGYVELNYALSTSMSYANIQNKAGNFVLPSVASTAAALNTIQKLPSGDQSWRNVTLLNSSDANAYPVVSLTYILVYKELYVVQGMTLDKAKALTDFLWFMVHDGQLLAERLFYAPLPLSVLSVDEISIKQITFNGQVVLPNTPIGPSVHVKVTGQQFSWSFTCASPCISTGPGTLTVPRYATIILNVTSNDEFHSLSIPELHVKADAIRGMFNTIWFNAPAGTYRIECIELCGPGHLQMVASLTVV